MIRWAPLLLAGCVAEPVSVTRPSGLSLVPFGGGLQVAGSGGREIGFGRDRPGALQSVARVEGRVPRPVACAAPDLEGYATSDGLVLVFTERSFVGWSRAGRSAGRTC